jgi:zinc transport system substrate-binding protein
MGFVEESPGKEPTPKELSILGNIIKEHQVKAIFLEPQMDRKAGETLAQEFNLKLLMLDPLGSDGKAKTIAQLIDYNWQSMKGGF